jgi:hypothetical protein
LPIANCQSAIVTSITLTGIGQLVTNASGLPGDLG